MTTVFFDLDLPDDERRAHLFKGDIFVYSPSPESLALTSFARTMVEEAFAPDDPEKIHERKTPEELSEILSRVKPSFIHAPDCKRLIATLLERLGCDGDQVYFDVPRLRTAYPTGHLTSGIAYAFHAHRDTWYSAPMFQINWWLPVYPLSLDNCLAFYPAYFDHPIANNSEIYNYYRWNASSRAAAASQVRHDIREQPKPQEPVDGVDLRLIPPPGSLILFSGAQLHATVENTSGSARYSVDFRTIHRADAERRGGARNIDSRCTGTTMRDYLRCSDLTRLPDEVVGLYDDGTERLQGAALTFG